MNIQLRPPGLSYVTQAAEGLERRRWTVAEIEAMVEVGIIDPKERFELIDGEVVPMSPKGIRHEVIKGSLLKWWMKRMPEGIEVVPETTFRLDESGFLEPDFVFYRTEVGLAGLKPSTCLLAVEVADSSLRYDTGRKATIYAAHGVRDLWAINAVNLQTTVFTEPSPEGYRDQLVLQPDELLLPRFAPEIALRLAELKLV